MDKCKVCGRLLDTEELEKHAATHGADYDMPEEAESRLLRRAGEEEQARKRTRGPYRKSHTA